MQKCLFGCVAVLLLLAAPGLPVQAQAPEGQPFEDALRTAQKSGKKVLVDVYAPWCGWCRKLRREVYTRPDVRTYLAEHFEFARLNSDDPEKTYTYGGQKMTAPQLAVRLHARGVPTTVFLQPDGTFITRLPGFVEAEMFLSVLRYIGTEAYQEQSFQEFVGAPE